MTVAVVQFSTGAGAAEVAYRAMAAYDEVVLLTADTTIEDEDNWRFAKEVAADLGSPEWVIVRDGRNPMQVGRDRSCIPSDRMKVCSQELKTKIMRAYIKGRWTPDECVILLGYDWTEGNRIAKAIEPWKPYDVAAILVASAVFVLYGCRHRFHPLDLMLTLPACALLGPLVVLAVVLVTR